MYNNVRTDDVEKFIITLVVMSTKLLCATDYLEKTLRYKTLKLFTVMAYLAHPSWVSFKDFLRVPVQEDNQHVCKNCRFSFVISVNFLEC
jgi:hypothetical protein